MAPTSGALGLHWVFVIPATARSPRTVHSNVLPPHTTSSLGAGPVGHGPVSSGISSKKGAKLPGDRTRSKITERQAGGWITVRKEMPPSRVGSDSDSDSEHWEEGAAGSVQHL